MVMVIERLLLGEHHRLRRQTFATMAERLPWNVSAMPPALLHHPARKRLIATNPSAREGGQGIGRLPLLRTLLGEGGFRSF
jgi:hypothetical protein